MHTGSHSLNRINMEDKRIMAQENSYSEALQYSEDLKALKKLIKSEDYVSVSVGYYIGSEWVLLHKYDLPRWLYDNKQWVIRWRIAKELCKYPKYHVISYLVFYDKKAGFDENKKSILQKITNHYTQIKKIERALADHEINCKSLLMVTPKEEQMKQHLLSKLEWRKSELKCSLLK